MLTENSIAYILLVASALVYPTPHLMYQSSGVLQQNGSKFQLLAAVRANQPLVVKGEGKESEFFCYLLRPANARLGSYAVVEQSEQGCDITYTPHANGDLFLQMRNPTDVPIHYRVTATQ